MQTGLNLPVTTPSGAGWLLTKNSKAMKTLSKQIEESILDGINTYKELAAIGRGFDLSAFSKMCAGEIRREALRDVDKAFDEFVKDRIVWWNELTPNRLKAVVKDMKLFATYYAQRCGVDVDGERVLSE